MKYALAPNKLTLRRARHLHVVLFGAFVFCYLGVLQSERILAWLHASGHDTLGPRPLAAWHVALPAALVTMAIFALWQRYHHLPKEWSGQKRLAIMTTCAFTLCLITSPSETDTLALRMQRLNRQGQYAEAIEASNSYAHPTAQILTQRITALEAQHELYDKFFTYPLADSTTMQSLPDRAEAHTPCPEELALLLRRDLDGFAALIKRRADADPTTLSHLQRAEREALILYAHRRETPIILYTEANTEANYRDFCDYRTRHTNANATAEANIVGDNYGDTYWHYYYYN